MCGIVAVISNHRSVTESRMRAGIDALRHRGPDGQGVWISPDSRVGLGHARLSIIDLQGGAQPIANEFGRIHVVANGEFYGFEEIQRDLQRRGHTLSTRSDSEIALHLYEDHGVDCLRFLRGEFAFAIWDQDRQACFAARDRFGIKPLYYAERPEGLYLASEAKSLFALGVSAEWDHESFFLACHGHLNDGRTLFRGIRQVPPGHYVMAKQGSIQLVQYWDWDYQSEPDTAGQDQCNGDVAAMLARDLEESVRLRLRADVPVAVYLSGGIDSSVVLGLASQQASEPLDAFTISFVDQSREHFDETAIAEETARHCGAHFHPVPVTSLELAEHFAAAVTVSETLHWNPHGVAKYLLSRAVRRAGLKVVLTGEGADEVILGYPWFQLDHLQPYRGQMRPTVVDRTLKLVLGLSGADQASVCVAVDEMTRGIRSQIGYLPWFVIIEAWFGAHLRGLLSSDFMAPFADLDAYRSLYSEPAGRTALVDCSPPKKSAYLWAKSAFPNYILNVLADRMEMAHSIEGRVPFLDHRLVEGIKDAPLGTFFTGRTEKQVLRSAMSPVLTPTVMGRRKFPFIAAPPRSDGVDPFSEMLQDELRSAALESLPFFDVAAVRRYLDANPSGKLPTKWAYGHGRILTQIASACVLHRSFRMS